VQDPALPPRRRHLDGLRAVAVYLVLLLHSGSERFEGGYIGVDMFFVLSGYLVTEVLVGSMERFGKMRLTRFYARRVRRLLPAAAAALLVSCAVLGTLVPHRGLERAYVEGGARAAFLYVENWYLIGRTGDFFFTSFANPTTHFWSLSIEEQFYLVWPLLLGGLFLLSRRRDSVRWFVLGGVLASLAATLFVFSEIDAYRRTDARAYQLLTGAFLTLSPGMLAWFRERRDAASLLAVPALLGIVLLATSEVEFDLVQRGVLTTALTALLILCLDAAPRGIVARLLSLGPIVYLGLISYGTYLWQWPVVVVAGLVGDPNNWQLTMVTALVATGIASLSYQVLERPIRESAFLDRVPKTTIAVGLAFSVVCAFWIAPELLRGKDQW
jgi:peptidoglycan/LPS O-acetylase OafA/YrhL